MVPGYLVLVAERIGTTPDIHVECHPIGCFRGFSLLTPLG